VERDKRWGGGSTGQGLSRGSVWCADTSVHQLMLKLVCLRVCAACMLVCMLEVLVLACITGHRLSDTACQCSGSYNGPVLAHTTSQQRKAALSLSNHLMILLKFMSHMSCYSVYPCV
jgi:hypothetical protein